MLVWTERELAEVYAQKAVETNVSIEEVGLWDDPRPKRILGVLQ